MGRCQRGQKRSNPSALMKDVKGWPKKFPTGLIWNSTHQKWNLRKAIRASCQIDLTFLDKMQGLLDALNGLNGSLQ